MAKDIEQELDAILTHHKARVTQARSEAQDTTATGEGFAQGAALCLMAEALHQRGVAARVHTNEGETRIDMPVT